MKSLNKIVLLSFILTISMGQIFNNSYAQERTVSTGEILKGIFPLNGKATITEENVKLPPPLNGKATITEENAKLSPPLNGKATITEENVKLPPPLNGKATITEENVKLPLLIKGTATITGEDTKEGNVPQIGNSILASPNITPNQPSGWGDKIVVSNVTGTKTDAGTIYTNENVYVDWSVTNNGTAATAVTFYTKLYVDDVEKGNWSITAPMNVGVSMGAFDANIGTLTAGTHTFKIVTDVTNVIGESNENDNEYQRSKIIIINNTQPVIRIEPTSITIIQ